jgi:hypothetical protein
MFFKKPTLKQQLQARIQQHEQNLVSSEDHAGYYRKMAEYHREALTRLRLQAQAEEEPNEVNEARALHVFGT